MEQLGISHNSMGEWAYLERGLLRRVFIQLADADAFSFRRVCRTWRVAAGDGSAVFRPWFIVQPTGGTAHHAYLQPAGPRGRFRVVSVDDDADAVKGTIDGVARGASRGWLAVNEGKRLFLRDPTSLAEIPLPAIKSASRLFDIFLSDDPLAAPGRWTLFAFFRRSDSPYSEHELAFCRASDDKWARIDAADDDGQASHQAHHGHHQIRFFRGLEFLRGRAYVVLADYSVAVCDVDARRLVVSAVKLDVWPNGNNGPDWQAEGLVACGGDLLFAQVARNFVPVRRSPRCLGMVAYNERFEPRVIKIELDAGGAPVRRSEVEEVGDHALFLAPHGHAFALPASGFPSVRAGCVYHFIAELRSGMVVSDLRESPYRHEIVRKLPLAGPWRPLAWFCPRRPILGKPSKRR